MWFISILKVNVWVYNIIHIEIEKLSLLIFKEKNDTCQTLEEAEEKSFDILKTIEVFSLTK